MKQALIESLLPGILQRTLRAGQPLSALTEIMEALHEPDEEILRNVGEVFNSRQTPDRFVPFLARWVDLGRFFEMETPSGMRSSREDHLPGLALGRLRELTASAARCSQLRGTARGLLYFLNTATGDSRFRLRENMDAAGLPRLFHLVVFAPSPLAASRPLIERIIQSEKPACVTSELVFEEPAS